jgi:hypothetical protein
MRKHAKKDRNHFEIVAALRATGASVADTASLGSGFPDLVVGYRNQNYLMEIKDGALCLSRKALTKDEELFRQSWRGNYSVVETVKQAFLVIGIII